MPTRTEIEHALREIGAQQHGLVTRAQLLARGVSRHAIDRMLRTGRLVARLRGVYQVGPMPFARAPERAALLACSGGRLSHASAAALHGLLRADRGNPDVEVTMPRSRRRRIDGVHVHHVRDLEDDEVTVLDGIPVTTPARTLLDIAEVLTLREVEQALAAALRAGLVTRDDLHAMIRRHPHHRGAAVLRSLLEPGVEPSFTRSEAEERLLALTREARLPCPELNVRLLGYEVDFLWRRERLVVEVDGYEYHGSARAFVADRQRDAELTAAGYRVLRFTWADLESRLTTVVRLAQALAR